MTKNGDTSVVALAIAVVNSENAALTSSTILEESKAFDFEIIGVFYANNPVYVLFDSTNNEVKLFYINVNT